MLNSTITDKFFALSNVAQVHDFVAGIDRASKSNAAFAALIEHWLVRMAEIGQDKSFPFNPRQFMSVDQSCVMYGANPIIFLGANDWGAKRLEDFDFLATKAEVFAGRAKMLAKGRGAKFSFVIVPEKDIVIDKLAGRVEKYANIDKAMAIISESCDGAQLPYVYDGFIERLPFWASEDDYGFSDSHLLTRDYLMIFLDVMQKWGLDGHDLAGQISQYSDAIYSDFNVKFEPPLQVNPKYLYPKFSNNAATVIDGDTTFASPLGNTVQKIFNPNAKLDATLEIFGDSHSSILSSRKMTYMFSSVFKHCTMHWNPWGVRQQAFDTHADFAIMEISQRFVF